MRIKFLALGPISKGRPVAAEDYCVWEAKDYDLWVGVAARDIIKDEIIHIDSAPGLDTADVCRDPRSLVVETLCYGKPEDVTENEMVRSTDAPDPGAQQRRA